MSGGLCFVILFRIYSRFKDLALFTKCVIGTGVITTLEFVTGCIVNLWLKMDVWDYSQLSLNVLGQICPLYSLIWGFISIPIDFITKRINKKFKVA